MVTEVWVKDLFRKVGKKLLVAQSRAVAEGFIILEPFFLLVSKHLPHTTISISLAANVALATKSKRKE